MGAPRWKPRGWSRSWPAVLLCGLIATGAAVAEESAPPPEPLVPPVKRGLTRGYADIRGTGVDAFASLADLRAGVVDRHVPGSTFVAVRDQTAKIAGVTYHKTDQGWIAASALSWKTPSGFTGLDLRGPAPTLPFAWVMPARRGDDVAVRAAPGRRATVVRALSRRELVTVLEQQGAHTRVGEDEWVESARLRVARPAARPGGVAADERWIDIDLDQQVLIAYEGDAPVYATLVSTGRKKWRTPPGVYRIRDKIELTRMRSPDGFAVAWNVAEVPWAMAFRKHFALHGAYWHDGFGVARSHGCVNLAPGDARVLYAWSAAGDDVPHTGTVIRIRSRRTPDPPWRDFDGDPFEPAAP